MRTLVIGLALAIFPSLVFAQQPAAPAVTASASQQMMKSFSSSDDVKALIAKARSERKDGQPLVSEPLLKFDPYTVNLEYRASVGNAAVHEKEAEVFYVIDGTATMVTGGKLVGENRTNPTNLTGTAIEGGMTRTISTGDFIVAPEGTPHWFSKIDGVLVLMTFHVPRG